MIDSEKIIRGEIFSRLKVIEKYYYILKDQVFPTSGSEHIVKLILDILQLLQNRFDKFTIQHIRFIGSKCCDFEELCGYLLESRITNVPWSIVPTLEKVFQSVKPGAEFAICPMWESNYSILKRDVINDLKEIAKIPNLLFDANSAEELDSLVKNLFTEFPASIFFIFFPKAERLSVLHFALLGHEIGHTFAQTWIDTNYDEFLKKTNFIANIEQIATTQFKEQFNQEEEAQTENIFAHIFKVQMIYKYEDVIKKILSELLSDVFGAFLFGETALIASYLFAQRSDIDSVQWWEKGYLSFRYRLWFVWKAIEYLKSKKTISVRGGNWDHLLKECIGVECEDIHIDDKYLQAILKILNTENSNLFEIILNEVGDNLYSKYVNEDEIQKVKERLINNIVPNAYLDEQLHEHPIEFRNILYGTCLYLAEQNPANHQEYERRTKIANLLSLKGIELSAEQMRFNSDTN